jgi:hypothetical protein
VQRPLHRKRFTNGRKPDPGATAGGGRMGEPRGGNDRDLLLLHLLFLPGSRDLERRTVRSRSRSFKSWDVESVEGYSFAEPKIVNDNRES